MRLLGNIVDKLTQDIAGDKDKFLYILSKNWELIVGSDVSNNTTPFKICYGKSKTNSLYLLVNNAGYNLILRCKHDLIVGRINCYLGNHIITKIITVLN